MGEQIRAAGGVIWRRRDGVIEVLLVHRARYDDWTFPKGKLDPGETWEQAALREVREESAVVAELGPELVSTAYRDGQGRSKRVRYWAMTVVEAARFEPDDEISAVQWLTVEAAASTLTYERDRPVLDSFSDRAPHSGSG